MPATPVVFRTGRMELRATREEKRLPVAAVPESLGVTSFMRSTGVQA